MINTCLINLFVTWFYLGTLSVYLLSIVPVSIDNILINQALMYTYLEVGTIIWEYTMEVKYNENILTILTQSKIFIL